MKQTTIELSYTTALAWANGDVDGALNSYYRRYREPTAAMQYGKDKHGEWDRYIVENLALPKELGGYSLGLPITENYLRVSLNDVVTIKFVPDCVDFLTGTVYEFKTGKTGASEWGSSHQAVLYSLALEKKFNITIQKILYCHYNQYTGQSDRALVWPSQKKKEESLDWFMTHALDILNYLNRDRMFDI